MKEQVRAPQLFIGMSIVLIILTPHFSKKSCLSKKWLKNEKKRGDISSPCKPWAFFWVIFLWTEWEVFHS